MKNFDINYSEEIINDIKEKISKFVVRVELIHVWTLYFGSFRKPEQSVHPGCEMKSS